MLCFGITSTRAQSSQAEVRRSPEEQAAYERSLPRNPSKTVVAGPVDPRMDPAAEQAVPLNRKPVKVADDERMYPEPEKGNRSRSVAERETVVDGSQPAGLEPAVKAVNRRDLKGAKTQPDASTPATVTRKGVLKGQKTQPEGEKPKR